MKFLYIVHKDTTTIIYVVSANSQVSATHKLRTHLAAAKLLDDTVAYCVGNIENLPVIE